MRRFYIAVAAREFAEALRAAADRQRFALDEEVIDWR
jgi:hypothetical protein